MHKILSIILLAVTVTGIFCTPAKKTQVAVAPPPPPPAPVIASDNLLNLDDSASYAIGVSVASFYKEQGIGNINADLLIAAVKDVLSGKKTKLDEAACNAVINKAMTQAQENKSKANIDSGAAFLQRNKLRPEVKTTESGLQYEVITQGGGAKPLAEDSVTCHYRGTLLNGTEFDNSYSRGEPITFPLNRVIPGWTEGLQLMNVGSKYKLYIPYTLAYGAFDNGPIPGGSMLIFEVELLDVKKAAGN
jgi:FKBP-type peptidyl-prolyl cis-trans isomerase FklB